MARRGDWKEVGDGGLLRDATLPNSSLHFSEIMQLPPVDQKPHEFYDAFPFAAPSASEASCSYYPYCCTLMQSPLTFSGFNEDLIINHSDIPACADAGISCLAVSSP